MTKQEFLERARDKHGYKYTYPNLPNKVLSSDSINIEYKGIIYTQKVVKHILLGRCPEKNTPTKTTRQFIRESHNIWGKEKYDYSLVDYKNSNTKVKIIYDGVVFEQNPMSHLNGMAPESLMNREWFIKKAISKWGPDKYDYSLIEYKHCKSKVKIIYKKTGEVFEQRPESHLKSAPEKILIRKTTELFIKESNQIHDFKYNYDKTEYTKNLNKVIITCPIHGDFTQRALAHIQGQGCPNCNESKGEKAIAKYLDKNNISYYRQHKFPDCRNVFELPFDFYIPSLRTAIEFDGKQHFEPIEYFGGLETFEKLQINDRIKSDYCEDNYIDLVRVKYTQLDNIEDYLKEVFRFKK